MSIKLQLPKIMDLRPRLTVIGVGGAGCNAINNMIAAGLSGVEFVVANTDAQALAASSAEHRIQLGVNLTEGLGAGSKPEIGEAAAEEAIDEIRSHITGAHMLFIAAGMGGGTGTGAATVIARAAKDLGVLSVGIVTKPFLFEGTRRQRIADAGIAELKAYVDTLIVIPNQNLFRIANDKTTFAEAFVLADQVLYSGVACIVDLIVKEGLINLDFADVRTIMSGMGTAMMGTGEASGDRRAIVAAEEAIANPLLDDITLKGARGLLLSITGSRDLTLYEVDEAASRVRAEVDPEANIIVGATFDDNLGDRVRVSIVASGMARAGSDAASPKPVVPAADSANRARVTPPLAPMPLAPVAGLPPMEPPTAAAEDFQRRMSEAMQVSPVPTTAAALPTPPQLRHAIGDAPARETWRAPGNVLIEDGPAPAYPAAAPPQPATGGDRYAQPAYGQPAQRPGGFGPEPFASAPATAGDPDTFVPSATADIRRRPPRMPELDEFPAVGQRDYRAKAGPGSDATPGRPPLPPTGGYGSSYGHDAQRKPGLFQRLTGIGRRADDSAGDSPSGRVHGTVPQGVPAGSDGRGSQDRDVAAENQRHRRAGYGASPRPDHDTRTTQENVELPQFFGRDRK